MTQSFRIAALMAALTAFPSFATEADRRPPVNAERPRIQIALLLDTSSSMDGLIAQAKEQLWKIVNSFATAKRDGQKPILEIALYEYGKDSLPAENGYIRQIVPLTQDLDRVSEQLFALTTNGGSEHCGQVIQKAVRQLEWSRSNKDLKLIFIAGNEPFTQGPVDYRSAVRDAAERGIIVNTIHCGPKHEGERGMWQDAARLADGSFLTIDHNQAVARIVAPQDQELAQLSAQLNRTYIARGGEGVARQAAMDKAAESVSISSASARAAAKASAYYDNSGWDLIDATKNGRVKVEALAEHDLPQEMKKMSPEERKAFVAKKQKEREEIQKRIQQLNDERNKYIAEEMRKRTAKGNATLDEAMIGAARAQAEAKAFSF